MSDYIFAAGVENRRPEAVYKMTSLRGVLVAEAGEKRILGALQDLLRYFDPEFAEGTKYPKGVRNP